MKNKKKNVQKNFQILNKEKIFNNFKGYYFDDCFLDKNESSKKNLGSRKKGIKKLEKYFSDEERKY